MQIDELLESTNIATKLDKDELQHIGCQVVEEFLIDMDSRIEWAHKQEQWSKLALQVLEQKEWPWREAANVKYPILTTAALQFNARAYPSLIPNDGSIVKARTVGQDPDGSKEQAAIMVSRHMSFQLTEEVPGWEEGMDKLLFALPILGCMFKKTYYDPLWKVNCSHIVFPKHLVVNYYAKDLDSASRITEILEKYPNELREREQAGIFLKLSDDNDHLPQATTTMETLLNTNLAEQQGFVEPTGDVDKPRILLEQHRFLDLDDDGYKEPYIVTVDFDTKKVLRIVARYYADGIVRSQADNKLSRIIPTQYYTKFSFIPNPDGGFYDIGFGELLGPINHTVNTIVNQLIDAGTLSNLQSGFLGRGVRLKGGEFNFRPGEWKTVNSTGDDLRKGIVPLPVREPSNVLFQLLGQLIQSSKELSSVSETMVGKMPGQNTPATTTMAAIEQGLKVFSAIYKRLFRALGEEFKKLYKLNTIYMSQYEEFYDPNGNFADLIVTKEQYLQIKGVIPGADANASSEQARAAKAQLLMEMFPTIPNKSEVIRRILEAHDINGIDTLLQAPPPSGPSEAEMKNQTEMTKLQIEKQKADQDGQLKQAQADLATIQAQVMALQAQLQVHNAGFDQQVKLHDMNHTQALDRATVAQNQYDMDNKTALQIQKNILDAEVKKAAATNSSKE
jgi:chaperonin GroES